MRVTPRIRPLLLLLLLCFSPRAALASAEPARRLLSMMGDLGIGGVGGVAATTVQTGLSVREGGLALELFGRVRLLLQEDHSGGPLRRRDWDEASDFVHILRKLEYRRDFERVRVLARAGEVTGFTLGHGTIVRDYSSVADPDHPHSGLRLELTGERLGFSGLVDNFVNPSVLAGRLAALPFASVPGLVFGASLFLDPRAPLAVRHGLEGERLVDRAYNLQTHNQVAAVFGLDVEYTAGSEERGQVTPYLDLNSSVHGLGVHLGALARFPLGKQARLAVQAEYRAGTDSYIPGHVETFYDVDRYQAGLTIDPATAAAASPDHRGTKLAGLLRGLYGGQGVLAQAGLDLAEVLRLKAGFAHRPGPDANSLWVRASARPMARVDLGLLVLARGLGGPYGGGRGVMAMAETRVRVSGHIYALGQYNRTWSLDEVQRYFGMLQSFNVSLGADWTL